MSRSALVSTWAAVMVLVGMTASAQEGGPGLTRLLVTQVRVKPANIDTWRTLEREQVVPALRKAGVKQYSVWETLVGDQNEFVVVRLLPSFAEFNGPDLLEKALGARAAGALNARLRECIESSHSRIENSRDEFYLDPGAADFLQQLDRYHKHPLFRGIRYGNLWGRNPTAAVEKPEFIAGLKALADADLSLDSANPNLDLLEALLKISDRVPTLRIIVDQVLTNLQIDEPPPDGMPPVFCDEQPVSVRIT